MLGTFAEPVAQAGELIVDVKASALSPLAKARASGKHYSAGSTYPFVVGIDGAGALPDGRRVFFTFPRAPYGGMAERTVVPADHCLPLPDDLDDVTAAAIANPGMSSWAALTERARFQTGETVLINGATGASGRLAVQIARHMGAAKVVATGRNRAVLDALGADETIPLTDDIDALDAAFAAQFARRIDVVLDYLWGKSAERLLAAAARAAPANGPIRFVQIGTASGADIALPGALLRSSSIELMGSGIGSVAMPRLIAAIGAVLQAAVSANLALPMEVWPLSEAPARWNSDDSKRLVFTVA